MNERRRERVDSIDGDPPRQAAQQGRREPRPGTIESDTESQPLTQGGERQDDLERPELMVDPQGRPENRQAVQELSSSSGTVSSTTARLW